MKKKLHFLFIFFFCVFFAQSQTRGSIVSYEYKGTIWRSDLTNNIRSTIQAQFGNFAGSTFYWWATTFYINPIHDIDTYKVTYNTLNEKNQPTTATGLVVIPRTNSRLPITAYCHGTVFDKRTVPSNLCGAGDCFEINIPYLMASDGHIMAVPDYIGMGDSNQFHPYVEYESESNATIDIMRAARQMANTATWAKPNNTNYITGYSQGGHAGLATLKKMHAQNLWNEFNVRFVGVGGSPTDLSNTQFDYILNNPNYPTREYILYCIATAKLVDNTLFDNINTILKPEYVALYNQHILGQTGNVSWVPAQWNDMFLPGVVDNFKTSTSKLRSVLGKSNVYDFWNNVATRLYAISGDEQVNKQNSWLTEWSMRNKLPWWQKGLIKADEFSTLAGNTHSVGGIFSFIYWTGRISGYRNGWGNNWRNAQDNQDKGSAYKKLEGKNIELKNISESYVELKGEEKIARARIFNKNNELVASPEVQNFGKSKNISTKGLDNDIYKLTLTFEDGSTVDAPIMVEKPEYIEAENVKETVSEIIFPTKEVKMEGDVRFTVLDEKGKILLVSDKIDKNKDFVISKKYFENIGNYFVEMDNVSSKLLFTFKVSPNTLTAVSTMKIALSGNRTYTLNREKNEFKSIDVYGMDQKHILETTNNTFSISQSGVYLVAIHRNDGTVVVNKIIVK